MGKKRFVGSVQVLSFEANASFASLAFSLTVQVTKNETFLKVKKLVLFDVSQPDSKKGMMTRNARISHLSSSTDYLLTMRLPSNMLFRIELKILLLLWGIACTLASYTVELEPGEEECYYVRIPARQSMLRYDCLCSTTHSPS